MYPAVILATGSFLSLVGWFYFEEEDIFRGRRRGHTEFVVETTLEFIVWQNVGDVHLVRSKWTVMCGVVTTHVHVNCFVLSLNRAEGGLRFGFNVGVKLCMHV